MVAERTLYNPRGRFLIIQLVELLITKGADVKAKDKVPFSLSS
jgi:hypothetical protein